MKKIPLKYYVNLFITEKCIELYDPNGVIAESDYYTHFLYIRTYIKSNTSNRPDKVNYTVWELIKAMGDMYGFNPKIAAQFIANYFVGDVYKGYLDYVITCNRYLEYKN
jgi:hypothetical protein